MRESPSEPRLPPLNALRAFEAAGRLQSIRGAAGELVVTPGAVSRHIRVLEEWLGVTLFRRTAHSVSLTQAGQAYLTAVGPHLRAIAAATERMAPARRRRSSGYGRGRRSPAGWCRGCRSSAACTRASRCS